VFWGEGFEPYSYEDHVIWQRRRYSHELQENGYGHLDPPTIKTLECKAIQGYNYVKKLCDIFVTCNTSIVKSKKL
jgi:hypothetical protein